MAGTLNLYKKILKITDKVGKIEKTGRNSMQNYSFIEHAEVVTALRPLMEKYGILVIPETVSRNMDRFDVTRSNGKQGVDIHVSVVSRYTVIDADKPEDRFVCEWDAGEAIDSSDKATNKATTASEKTFLMKLFKISDRDDADASSPEAPKHQYATKTTIPMSDKQRILIASLLEKKGVDADDMVGYVKEQYEYDLKALTVDLASELIEVLQK